MERTFFEYMFGLGFIVLLVVGLVAYHLVFDRRRARSAAAEKEPTDRTKST